MDKPTDQKEPSRRVSKPLDCPAWYWYQFGPVYVSRVDNIMVARGYNFTTKEEWRTPVSEMDRAKFIPLEPIIGAGHSS